VVAGLLCVVTFLLLLYRAASPHLLLPERGASWVVAPNPVKLEASRPEDQSAAFRATLELVEVPPAAVAELRSLGRAGLYVNGNLLSSTEKVRGRVGSSSVDLAPALRPEINEIVVVVHYSWRPAAILFFSESLAAVADVEWTVKAGNSQQWTKAKQATAIEPRPQQMRTISAPAELAAHAGTIFLLALLGAMVAVLLQILPSLANHFEEKNGLRRWRWILIGLLAALFARNFGRIPDMLGMDMPEHIEYMDYILRYRALPYADQGWQMFQPPLAYLVGASVEFLRARIAPGLDPLSVARLLTLGCSLGIAWIGCRICDLSIKNSGAAAVAMVAAAFLPVNIYMGQAFGNEAFAGLFGALLILEAVRLLLGHRATPALLLRMGIWAGLGLLSKPSVLLLLPALAVVVGWRVWERGGWASMVRPLATVFGSCLAISGWWYARNMLKFGRPFVGGWEPGRGVDWWQYPGYRVPEHWLRFGEALVRPYYAAVHGFWDGLYSTLWLDGSLSGRTSLEEGPPWNLEIMAALAILSLPLVLVIIWGAGGGVLFPGSARARRLSLFAGGNIVVFLMAIALVFARVPSYSAVKASYMLPAITCLPILAGLGVEPLMKHLAGRVVISGLSVIWLGFVVLAFAT
jgi:hypothetical protein